MITTDQILAAARRLDALDIPTIGDRSTFRVQVVGDSLVFVPESTGRARAQPRSKTDELLEIYNSTESELCSLYTEHTQNASYFLGLLRAVRDLPGGE